MIISWSITVASAVSLTQWIRDSLPASFPQRRRLLGLAAIAERLPCGSRKEAINNRRLFSLTT